jgi:uncharacterized protein (UPF0212 family)
VARIDELPDERDREPLRLVNIVTCPLCDTDFDQEFVAADGIFEREDLVDSPESDARCPACGHRWHVVWGGWSAHEDAG